MNIFSLGIGMVRDHLATASKPVETYSITIQFVGTQVAGHNSDYEDTENGRPRHQIRLTLPKDVQNRYFRPSDNEKVYQMDEKIASAIINDLYKTVRSSRRYNQFNIIEEMKSERITPDNILEKAEKETKKSLNRLAKYGLKMVIYHDKYPEKLDNHPKRVMTAWETFRRDLCALAEKQNASIEEYQRLKLNIDKWALVARQKLDQLPLAESDKSGSHGRMKSSRHKRNKPITGNENIVVPYHRRDTPVLNVPDFPKHRRWAPLIGK